MTLESIGFAFGRPYEGVGPGKRRTAEGIGAGSTINELLDAYGRPAETSVEGRGGGARSVPSGKTDRAAPVRHLYRSADKAVTTYFVVESDEVVRMALGRPAAIEKFLLKKPPEAAPAPGPAAPETPSQP
jgi:hypothetical protein